MKSAGYNFKFILLSGCSKTVAQDKVKLPLRVLQGRFYPPSLCF